MAGALLAQWTPFKCMHCEGLDHDERRQEVKVNPLEANDCAAKSGAYGHPDGGRFGSPVGADGHFGDAGAVSSGTWKDLRGSLPIQSDGAPPSRASPRELERSKLRDLMKEWVGRGMRGVAVEMLDEAGTTFRAGSYSIDARLQYLTFLMDGESPSQEGVGPLFDMSAPFAQMKEALCADEAFAFASSNCEGSVLPSLSMEQVARLIVVVYTPSLGSDTRKVFLLESSPAAAQDFATCVRILRRYMEEQGGRLAHQARC